MQPMPAGEMPQADALHGGSLFTPIDRLILAGNEGRDADGPHYEHVCHHVSHHSHTRMNKITNAVATKLVTMSRVVVTPFLLLLPVAEEGRLNERFESLSRTTDRCCFRGLAARSGVPWLCSQFPTAFC